MVGQLHDGADRRVADQAVEAERVQPRLGRVGIVEYLAVSRFLVLGQAQEEVDAPRVADACVVEPLERHPGGTAAKLLHQDPHGQGVVAEGRARAPQRRRGRETPCRGGRGELRQGKTADDAGQPRLMGQGLPHGEPVLALDAELRPVGRDGPVEVEPAVLDEEGDHECGDSLGTGIGARDVAWREARAAAKVHHLGAAAVDGQLRAVARVIGQEGVEELTNFREFGGGKAGRDGPR